MRVHQFSGGSKLIGLVPLVSLQGHQYDLTLRLGLYVTPWFAEVNIIVSRDLIIGARRTVLSPITRSFQHRTKDEQPPAMDELYCSNSSGERYVVHSNRESLSEA